MPFSLPQRWPFCWWVLVAADHVSRAIVGLEIFGPTPGAAEVEAAVAAMIRRASRPPRYVITDQGPQFRSATWKGFCREHEIRPRFGAVGKHGGIAVVEGGHTRPRWEPRARWPRGLSCALPRVEPRGKPGVKLRLVVSYLQGRRHLPIVASLEAA